MSNPKPQKANGATPEVTWLSSKQAIAYVGKTKAALTAAVARYPEIFIDGKTMRTRVIHEDYPALHEFTKDALDAWTKLTADRQVGSRATRSGAPRRYVIRIPDAQADAIKQLLAQHNITLEVAYKSRNKQSKSANAPASAPSAASPEAAPIASPSFEQTLVEV